MIRISEFVLNFLLNAAWQTVVITLVAMLCAHLLKRAPARFLHALWVLSLLLCVSLPLWSLVGIAPETSNVITQQPKKPARWFENSPAVNNLQPASPAASTAQESSSRFGHIFQNRRRPLETDARLLVMLALGYTCFVLYRIGRLGLWWKRTQSLRRSIYRREIPAQMTLVAAHCQAALRLKSVPLVCSAAARAPVTIGARKPLIILPESFYQERGATLL